MTLQLRRCSPVPWRDRRARGRTPCRSGVGRWLLALILLVHPGCSPGGADDEEGLQGRGTGSTTTGITRILILAASDLATALPELAREFEAVTGVASDLVLGSSGNLAAQVEQGAPADLFLSADRSFVDRLEGRGRLEPDTRRDYAVGPLTLLLADGRPVPARVQELDHPSFQVIALANPEHAPYGRAAREAMERAGVWDRLAPRLVFAENVAQAAQFVRTGNADAGFVALGLIREGETGRHLPVVPGLHAPLIQAGAVVRGSRYPSAAAAFLEWMAGAEGQAILGRFGFLPPPGSGPEGPLPEEGSDRGGRGGGHP